MSTASPALQAKPRELYDVLIADRERTRKWLLKIRDISTAFGHVEAAKWCAMALENHEPPT